MADAKTQPEQKGRFIVERQYIDDRRINEPKKLDAGGIDISGRWGVLIEPRTITTFDHTLMHEVQREPGGRFIHRCFQCGNCTAARQRKSTRCSTRATSSMQCAWDTRLSWRRSANTFTSARAAGVAPRPARGKSTPPA
jgi:hypothetical protein